MGVATRQGRKRRKAAKKAWAKRRANARKPRVRAKAKPKAKQEESLTVLGLRGGTYELKRADLEPKQWDFVTLNAAIREVTGEGPLRVDPNHDCFYCGRFRVVRVLVEEYSGGCSCSMCADDQELMVRLFCLACRTHDEELAFIEDGL